MSTDQQLRALAYLMRTCRDDVHGGTALDEPGIMVAAVKVRHLDIATVTMAGMRLAADRSIRTPALLGDPSSSVYVEKIGPERSKRNPTPTTACHRCSRDMDRHPYPDCADPTRPTPRDPEEQTAAYTAQAALARAALHERHTP